MIRVKRLLLILQSRQVLFPGEFSRLSLNAQMQLELVLSRMLFKLRWLTLLRSLTLRRKLPSIATRLKLQLGGIQSKLLLTNFRQVRLQIIDFIWMMASLATSNKLLSLQIV